MRNKLIQGFKALLRSLFLYETNYETSKYKSRAGWNADKPVRTIKTATVILTASSTLPMKALTKALPHSKRLSGLSYIVFANFKSTGSGADTENSLYPCCASSDETAAEDRPSEGEVRKWDKVSWRNT